MGKFIVSNKSDGQYYFIFKANNGQTILSSEGYTTKSNCLNGIESVKRNSLNDSRYVRRLSPNGKHYFYILASNGQIIGASEMYVTESGMNNGIDSVKRNASSSPIEDKS